jgi:hypothetical protein
MSNLYLHKQPVKSIFNLLGKTENAITSSLGWALSSSPELLRKFLKKVTSVTRHYNVDRLVVSLQEFRKKSGITDIEIRDEDCGENLHVIIEAKRGWDLPSKKQLKKYVPRFRQTKAQAPVIVTMSECSEDYAHEYGVKDVNGIPVRHISWSDVNSLSQTKSGTHAEKHLMQQLRNYLSTIVNMQQQESNWVYVVSLSHTEWAKGLSFIQTVEKRRRYFHPTGGAGGFPKEPPNYIGFRYGSVLQSIHHIESWEVFKNFHKHFPESPDWEENKTFFLYRLGPPIRPTHTVKSGKVVRALRVWAMLDLLLTCATISDARDASDKRAGRI